MIEAIIWDFGGVFTTSPFEAFARFEKERGLPENFIRSVNSRNYETNAWALFEQNAISMDAFDETFAQECNVLGHEVRGRDVVALLSGDIRPEMVEALRRCKQKVKVGCITNNVAAGEGAGMAQTHNKAAAVREILSLFDNVIESSKAGVRKPDPRIYLMSCEALGVKPEACIYLDDLGVNLKPAKALGMATIRVSTAGQALDELEALTGFTLR